MTAGMWGGTLPKDWDSVDGELYAIYAFLLNIHETSEDLSQERVLVLSDCRSALDAIDRLWARGDSS